MTVAELAYEQIKTLPENQAREVLGFICYLKINSERVEWESLTDAQADSLGCVCDDPEDEVWNDL